MFQPKIELIKKQDEHPFYIVILDELDNIGLLELPSQYFKALIVLDKKQIINETLLETFLHNLLKSGCRYFLSFGTARELVHSKADRLIVDGDYETGSNKCILTSSHKSLKEAIWFLGSVAEMDEAWESEASPNLVIILSKDKRVSKVTDLIRNFENLE